VSAVRFSDFLEAFSQDTHRSVLHLHGTLQGENLTLSMAEAGEWESSGILDVSELFGEKRGTLFLFDVQAHGIEDQDDFNADSRITDGDLVEGGQLSFLMAPPRGHRR
jgi:hypothetical protein